MNLPEFFKALGIFSDKTESSIFASLEQMQAHPQMRGLLPNGEMVLEIMNVRGHSRPWPKTQADLDEIAQSYDPEFLEAPVKLDHVDDGPAYGWVRALWREGDSLFARLSQVSKDLRQKVKEGSYKNRSVELYQPGHNAFAADSPQAGKPYLRGLAFLGAAVPAVKGMAPITGFKADAYESIDLDPSARSLIFGEEPELNDKEAATMAEQEAVKFQEQLQAMEAKFAEMSAKFADLQKNNEAKAKEIEGFKEREVARAAEERSRLIGSEVERLVKEGKILPANQEPFAKAFAEMSDATRAEVVKAYDESPSLVPRGAGEGGNLPAPGDQDGKSKIFQEARDLAAKEGISFSEAVMRIERSKK